MGDVAKEQVWECEDCGDCTLLTIGPNTDGEPCDWCQNCGCHASLHHVPTCPCVACHLNHPGTSLFRGGDDS